jgi:hypothetical protein
MKTRALAYFRTSSATNVGPDKDSEKRQRAAQTSFEPGQEVRPMNPHPRGDPFLRRGTQARDPRPSRFCDEGYLGTPEQKANGRVANDRWRTSAGVAPGATLPDGSDRPRRPTSCGEAWLTRRYGQPTPPPGEGLFPAKDPNRTRSLPRLHSTAPAAPPEPVSVRPLTPRLLRTIPHLHRWRALRWRAQRWRLFVDPASCRQGLYRRLHVIRI